VRYIINIFYVDTDPHKAAIALVDRHVVKMPLESAQLLSTAHRVLDGRLTVGAVNGRKRTSYILPDFRESLIYKATHINHPSAVWARASIDNYLWLYEHFVALLNEYTHRYGKVHKCSELIPGLRDYPANITSGTFTPPTVAMASEFAISSESLDSYRNYYILGKKHLHQWKLRNPPEWINDLSSAQWINDLSSARRLLEKVFNAEVNSRNTQ